MGSRHGVPNSLGSALTNFLYFRVDTVSPYFATSTHLVSRITVMRIWPGYWSSFSMREAKFRANAYACSSSTLSGCTKTRNSRPAWTAKDFSTP